MCCLHWPLESLIFACAFPEETEALKSDNSQRTHTRIQRNLVSGGCGDRAGRHAGRCWNFLSRQESVYKMPFSHGRNTHTIHISNDSNFTLISSAFDLPNWQNSISANTFSMDTPTHTRNHARTHSLVETHTHSQTYKWILKRYANGTHSRRIAGRVLRTPVHWILGGVFLLVIY